MIAYLGTAPHPMNSPWNPLLRARTPHVRGVRIICMRVLVACFAVVVVWCVCVCVCVCLCVSWTAFACCGLLIGVVTSSVVCLRVHSLLSLLSKVFLQFVVRV